jgi:hypothetical protein
MKITYICAVLALIAALVYALLIMGVINAGDLSAREDAPGFFVFVPVCYAVGGFLILLKKRWLWIIGAFFNAIPILVFYAFYAARPDITLSVPGLISKIAQVLLEAGLIYLIVTFRRKQTTS